MAEIVHHDIKPDNFLVDKTDTVKISDFGVSKRMEESEYDANNREDEWGTRLYFAPESWAKKQGDSKALDIWALGCTIYEMIYNFHPFNLGKPDDLEKSVIMDE